jgi:hypothetical protein
LGKIFVFFELRGIDRGVGGQNIENKRLAGKIFLNKELADEVRRSRGKMTRFPVDRTGDGVGTPPVWALHILAQGCSSQRMGIFLWKAVEKAWAPLGLANVL